MGDKWVQNNYVFICDDIGYTVTPMGGTACIGPVDEEGNALEDVYKPIESPQTLEDSVSKLLPNGIILTDEISGSFETLKTDEKSKHPGGRHRIPDDGEMSKVTKWRRRKELQGVLFDV